MKELFYYSIFGIVLYFLLTVIFDNFNLEQENFDPSLVPVSSIVTLAKVAQKLVNGNGTLTNPGNLQIGASASAPGNLTVMGKTIINGNGATTALAVTGATTLGGTLGVTGATTVGGTLGVTGATTLSSATVSGALSAGATTLSSATVSGALSAGATTLSSATVSGALSAGATTLGGTLKVTGATILSGATTVGGTLGVTGATTLSSAIVSGALSAGATTIKGNLNVTDANTKIETRDLKVTSETTLSWTTINDTLTTKNVFIPNAKATADLRMGGEGVMNIYEYPLTNNGRTIFNGVSDVLNDIIVDVEISLANSGKTKITRTFKLIKELLNLKSRVLNLEIKTFPKTYEQNGPFNDEFKNE